MSSEMATSDHDGFTTPEWMLGIGLIIMPVVVIVASIAPWYQRANMATVIAQETARTMVLADDWAIGEDEARSLAIEIASNHGFAATDWCGSPAPGCLWISIGGTSPGAIVRGSEVVVQVEVPIPGVVVPGVGQVAEFQWAQSHTERVDDYRSIEVP
ncbi:MAG: hypothetical protein GY720_17195 [bacterium]|nr:hypothetical protein [bacterium]